MPSDVVTIVVSTGIGVSVIAGVLSGVCYILAHGFTRKRSRRPLLQWYCAVCGTYLRSRLVDRVKAVICLECEERVCKLRCAKREHTKRGWICYNCLKKPSLLKGLIQSLHQLRFNNFNQLIFTRSANNQIKEMDKDVEAIRKQEKDHIRDFIEKLVSTILGGNIDDASVFRVYNDKYYDTLFERYHQDLRNAITDLSSALHISITNAPDVVEQSPSTAHTNLKRLIQKLLEEAAFLPNLKRAVEHPSTTNTENERTYEELLATAIVNTVVSESQRKRSSSGASISSRVSTSSNKDNKEYFFGEETLETKWETTSNSSFDEYLQSDSSHCSTKYVDRVSLTIRQQIEEVPSTIVDEDVVDNLDTFADNSRLGDDSNWHLQKRQFHGTHSPVPVPMLVPNPVTTAKVLIGDKEAEETSDLSDAGSEYDENEGPEATGVHSYMLESKMIIGGQNVIDRIETCNTSDEETSADSGVKEDRDDLSEKDNPKPKADVTLDDENVEDASLTSINSNIERDSEYLEKYASLPRTITKSPPPSPRSQKSLSPQNRTIEDETLLKDKIEEDTPLVLEGSYSKKEKEKWKHPIEMPNNPYSKENLEKRSRSHQIFGRDYFPKETSLPYRKKKDEEEQNNVLSEELNTYRAVPVSVVQSIDLEEDDDAISQRYEITSDSDLSLVNCYDVENSKVYHQSFHPSKDDDHVLTLVNYEDVVYNPEEIEETLETEQVTLNPKETERIEETLWEPDQATLTSKEMESENIEEENKETKTAPAVKPRTFINKSEELPKRDTIEFSLEDNFVNKPPSVTVIQKPDNTIIKMIYSAPVVRSFALSSCDDDYKAPEIRNEQKLDETDFDDNNNHAFSLEYSDTDSLREDDINDLKQKRLVASQLNKFSKSSPNLSQAKQVNENAKRTIPEIFVSVKNLRKIFENNEAPCYKDKLVHSLTARSLSKPMKEKLKSNTSN